MEYAAGGHASSIPPAALFLSIKLRYSNEQVSE